ncbi:hypothetical protein E2L06_06780 [Haloterrigena sp. H1]|uniref:choice-of-anchor W domain-containing protein n=1 Tax=Haloterrigena sp. H1 TaxID=2552943 RepID=UPI00110D3DBE|nr:choice-of-anchor W domain-containing protein [Haloterrigena sp. H1]TMT86319.1 hypothetical protein E2L06_06780 [Haloterrigena sp. H1]
MTGVMFGACGPHDEDDWCIDYSNTGYIGFEWWIPKHVKFKGKGKFEANFDFKAKRCDDFEKTTTEIGDGFAKIEREFNGDGTISGGARARYGDNSSSGAWELAVGDEPGTAGEFESANYVWTSGETVDWSVSYDESSDELSFTFDGTDLSDTLDDPQPDGRMAIQGKADEATVEASIDSLSIGGSPVSLDGPTSVTASNDGSGREIQHLLVNTDLDGSTSFQLSGEATVTLQGDYSGSNEGVAFDVVFE